MSERLTFLRQFMRGPSQIGAIAPSGPALAKTMVDTLDWANIASVAEFGPGTGVFTEAILRRCGDSTRFFAIERSETLASVTRKRCPDATVYCDDAANVGELCRRHGVKQLDAVLSGLPWAAFDETLQDRILGPMVSAIRPGGHFATFAYVHGLPLPAARRFAHKLRQHFVSVEKSRIVWRNMPPAVVYRCRLAT